jgi:hypothetical protein
MKMKDCKKMINYIEKKEVVVVDDIMGSGKTSWAIQFINSSPLTHRFIFVTPYLKEIERIKKATKHKRDFIDPNTKNSKGTKLNSLKQLLENGADIITTHALFKEADEEVLDLLTLHHYVLLMDEVSEVVERIEISNADIQMLLNSKLIEVENDSKVHWKDKDYKGKFDSLKLMILTEKVFLHNGTAFIWTFPIEVFKKFRQIYILTYMFQAQIQRYYFDIHNLKYTLKSVEPAETSTIGKFHFTKDNVFNYGYAKEYKLVDYRKPDVSRFKGLINICEDEKLNNIGVSTTGQGFDNLTFSKLTKLKKSSPIVKTIKNNLYTWFRHRNNASSQHVMWTCPKDVKQIISPQGYSKGFISSNLRATNEFSDRTVCAYILNKFMNPSIVGFFESYNVTVDQDLYALSELVQWVFRSAIRDDKPIDLYIPSNRMKKLLTEWLEGQL